MQERLNAISFDSTIEGPPTKNPPVADSMAVLLMQGLLSSDKTILSVRNLFACYASLGIFTFYYLLTTTLNCYNYNEFLIFS